MIQKSSVEKLYFNQNISIRRSIRELDLYQMQESLNRTDLKIKMGTNILVMGPAKSGKSSLLRTIFYALNGTLNFTKQFYKAGNTTYQKMDIKKNKRVAVKGCSQIKETDNKMGITAIQMVNMQDHKMPFQKYSKASELINNKLLSYLSCSQFQGSNNIDHILICLSTVDKIENQDLVGLRYLIGEFEQKRIQYTIIGTKIDKILDSNQSISQQQKLQYIEQWKKFVVQSTKCNINNFYFIENYRAISKQQLQNSETVNFYALTLLHKIVSQSYKQPKIKKGSFQTGFFVCSC